MRMKRLTSCSTSAHTLPQQEHPCGQHPKTSARVKPDADLSIHALDAAHLLPRSGSRKSCICSAAVAGAYRVVLVSERRAEERHDAVAL